MGHSLPNCDVRVTSAHPSISDMMLGRRECRNGPLSELARLASSVTQALPKNDLAHEWRQGPGGKVLSACRDSGGRPGQTRFAVWRCLARQIEYHGLYPLARRFVGFSEPRDNWSRDFSHEAPVLLSRLELEFADDVLHRDVFQTALAKRCLHKSRCGTSEQSRRSKGWRG